MVAAPAAQRTVLWIDDEPSVVAPFQHVLAREGLTVVPAFEGHSGLALARILNPELLLIDFRLPGPSGLEILSIFKREHRQVPAILISAFTDDELTNEALSCGASRCLTKPFKSPTLVSAVRSVLEVGALRLPSRATSHGATHRLHVRVDPVEYDRLLTLAHESGRSMAGAIRKIVRQSMLLDAPPFHDIQGASIVLDHTERSADRVQVRFDATRHEARFLTDTASYCAISLNSLLRLLIRRAKAPRP